MHCGNLLLALVAAALLYLAAYNVAKFPSTAHELLVKDCTVSSVSNDWRCSMVCTFAGQEYIGIVDCDYRNSLAIDKETRRVITRVDDSEIAGRIFAIVGCCGGVILTIMTIGFNIHEHKREKIRTSPRTRLRKE